MARKTGKVTIGPRRKGEKAITFTKGGLHRSTHTPMDEKIPAKKMMKALAGDYGAKAQKQARLAKNVLAKGRKTSNRSKK